MTTKTTTRLVMPTTRRLTRPLAGDPQVRALGAALLGLVTLFALAFSANGPRPIQEAQPQVERIHTVFIIATPSPALPTIAPTAAPTLPPPTAEIVYVPVEVPVYVEVAPVVEAAPPTYAPPTDVPAPPPPLLVGERLDEYFKRTGITPVSAQP